MTDETQTQQGSASDAPANIVDAGSQAAAAPKEAAPPFAFTFQPEAIEQVFGKLGEDGRPANVPEKYWDKDKKALKTDVVFNQLKWAEGKLGKKVDVLGAPADVKEYKLTAPEGVELPFSADDPMVQGFFALAKENDWSQAHVDRVLGYYAKAMAQQSSPEAIKAHVEGEMKKLGDGAPQRVADVADYLKANLELEQVEAIKGLLTTAEAFQAVEALIAKAQPPRFVDRDAAPASAGKPTREDWEKFHFAKNERGERLVAVDPEYRKRSEAMRDAVFGTTKRDASGRAIA